MFKIKVVSNDKMSEIMRCRILRVKTNTISVIKILTMYCPICDGGIRKGQTFNTDEKDAMDQKRLQL